MTLNAADARRAVARQNANGIIAPQAPRPHGAGGDGSSPPDGKYPINRKPEQIFVFTDWDRSRKVTEGRSKFRDSSAGLSGCCDQASLWQHPTREGLNVIEYQRQPFRIYEIHLRERDDPAFYPKQFENRQMLSRLRHHAFIGGNDDKGHVNASCAGHHRAHEGLVSRNVDYSHGAETLEHERRKPKLDGDAASFLLRKSIGIHAGEDTYERRLSMIDVARCPQDHAAPCPADSAPVNVPCSQKSKALSGRSSDRCSRTNSRSNRW